MVSEHWPEPFQQTKLRNNDCIYLFGDERTLSDYIGNMKIGESDSTYQKKSYIWLGRMKSVWLN